MAGCVAIGSSFENSHRRGVSQSNQKGERHRHLRCWTAIPAVTVLDGDKSVPAIELEHRIWRNERARYIQDHNSINNVRHR